MQKLIPFIRLFKDRRGVAAADHVLQRGDDEAHQRLALGRAQPAQQVVVAREEGRIGRLAPGLRLRQAQRAEHACEHRVERVRAGQPVDADRRRPQRVDAGRQTHAARPAGQRSTWPVSRSKRSRSSGVSTSTR